MQTVTTKLPNDILEKVEQYQEDNDLTRSEAVRRLLQIALQRNDVQEIAEEMKRLNTSVTHLHQKFDGRQTANQEK